MIYIFLFIIASFIGIIASMIGVGGGSLLVPSLVILFSIPIHMAVSTSLLSIIFISLSSVIVYARNKLIDYKLGLLITTFSGLGAFLGAFISLQISNNILQLIFGLALIFVGILMNVKDRMKIQQIRFNKFLWERQFYNKENNTMEKYYINIPLVSSLTFLVGVYSGTLGLGGGTLFVPILYLTCGINMHLAVGTSMFIILSTSIFGSTGHIVQGNINPILAIPVIIGYILGAQIGSRISVRSSSKKLKFIFSIIMMLIGIKLILDVFI